MDRDYRSRLVEQDFKADKRADLIAAIPTIEALRIIMNMAVTEGIIYLDHCANGMKIDVIDVKRAYLNAQTHRDIFVQLPEEDHQPGMCAELNKAMYGTRDAASNWEEAAPAGRERSQRKGQCLLV